MKRLVLFIVSAISLLGMAARSDTTASMVIFYPGPDIYELEGHAALRLRTGQYDCAVSFGTFDFEQPHFVYRFVKGETDYWASVAPWQPFERAYERQGRRIEEFVLDLTPAQTSRLVDLVKENLRPENRTYRYNYVKDNCATRPLKLVEKALQPEKVQLGPVTTVDSTRLSSFRNVMRHYHRNYPWYQFGIDLALGSGIDYPLGAYELSFAPVLLAEQLKGARVGGRPLVKESIVLNEAAPEAAIEAATPWYLTPMTMAMLVLLLSIYLSWSDIRRGKLSRWYDTALFGIYGLAGCLLTFLIFVSVHEATSPNYLYLWLNPLCLITAIFIWIKSCKKLIICYQFINFALVITMLAGAPWWGQSANPAFIPLILSDLIRNFTILKIETTR